MHNIEESKMQNEMLQRKNWKVRSTVTSEGCMMCGLDRMAEGREREEHRYIQTINNKNTASEIRSPEA